MTLHRTAAILFAMTVLAGCSDERLPATPRSTQASATAPAPKFTCDFGQPADGRVVDVSGFGHDLYTKPDKSAPKLVNQKASAILKTTEYHTVDATTRVQVQCEHQGWVKVQLTEPEWLRHVSGWLEAQPLLAKGESGAARTFAEGDIFWDQSTTPHKAAILEAVNRIHRENPKCTGTLDPSSVARSSTRGTPARPVFFVTCGTGSQVENVWFTLD